MTSWFHCAITNLKNLPGTLRENVPSNTKALVQRLVTFGIIFFVFYVIWIYAINERNLLRFSLWVFNQSQIVQPEKELWNSFRRFVDPKTLQIHSNATWFAVSQLSKSFEQMDPGKIDEMLEDNLTEQLKRENISIQMGGYYSPKGPIDPRDCTVINTTLVIMIPYRNRSRNLISFLSFMHRYLPLKSVSYRVVVLEQDNNYAFNRAKLINAGLRELGLLIGEGIRPFVEDESTRNNCTNQCFILHDVDKLPVSMRTPYECHDKPWQLARVAVARNRSAGVRGNFKFKKGEGERKFYNAFFGGVTMVNKPSLLLVNGMSNAFYGWGGEDDDFRKRMSLKNISVQLTPLNYSRFYYLDHAGDSPQNQQVKTLLKNRNIVRRMNEDGIRQIHYTVHGRVVRPLYTMYKFNV